MTASCFVGTAVGRARTIGETRSTQKSAPNARRSQLGSPRRNRLDSDALRADSTKVQPLHFVAAAIDGSPLLNLSRLGTQHDGFRCRIDGDAAAARRCLDTPPERAS
jgi:hypothetical protein